MIRAAIPLTLALALALAGCGGDKVILETSNALTHRAKQKLSNADPIATKLERYLEDDHREFLDKGAKTFCEVEVVGIGRKGRVPATPLTLGHNDSNEPINGTPVYTYHSCDDYRPERRNLQALSGSAYPLRFVVAGIDTSDFRVVDMRGPMDGAANGESLRALFPDPYFEKLRDRQDSNRFAYLGCAAVTEARKHFDLPEAKVLDGPDACDPPS